MRVHDRWILTRVVAAYLAFSALWIVASDKAVELLSASASQLSQYQSIKGMLFVLGSTVVIFALLRRELNARTAAELSIRAQEAHARELTEARDRAEASDRLKSAFLATMSHELRTPLNSVLGFTGILLQEIPGKLNDEQRKQLGMIRSSARHLLALINDVLDLSKIEAGQLEVERAAFDVGSSIESAVASVAQGAADKGLKLEVSVEGELGELWGDRRRFEQVLLNLLSNAIKFTDAGAVTVEARRFPDATLEVRVRDTGIGISAADQARLFRPFSQVEDGSTRRFEGTGLGLSISLRLVELMEGRMLVSSTPGAGSTFGFSLPGRVEGKIAS